MSGRDLIREICDRMARIDDTIVHEDKEDDDGSSRPNRNEDRPGAWLIKRSFDSGNESWKVSFANVAAARRKSLLEMVVMARKNPPNPEPSEDARRHTIRVINTLHATGKMEEKHVRFSYASVEGD